MQEMFKFERSKVKFAQILVRPWPDIKAYSYTPDMRPLFFKLPARVDDNVEEVLKLAS